MAPSGQNDLGVSSTATTQANINAEAIKRININLPTLPEQTEIVRHVDELFAYADALEKRVADAKKMADRLEPAILAKAFRGELSEQRPEEAVEWALELARLEAEAEGMVKVGKPRAKKIDAAEAAESTGEYAVKRRGRPRKVR